MDEASAADPLHEFDLRSRDRYADHPEHLQPSSPAPDGVLSLQQNSFNQVTVECAN